jgi:hypothetical protein
MPHFFVIAALVLVDCTLLCFPLGVFIGRRLRRVNSTPLPPGCAYLTGRAEVSAPGGGPASGVPGCTARPCRTMGTVTCATPRKGSAARTGHGLNRWR